MDELARATGLNLTQRRFMLSLARAGAGTGLMMLGYYLGYNGRFSGGMPKDEGERGLFREENRVADAVLIGATWYGLRSLGPIGMLLGIGAGMGMAARKLEASWHDAQVLAEGAAGGARVWKDTPLNRGVQDMASFFEDPSGTRAQRLLGRNLSSFVPSAVAGVARSMDPVQDRDQTQQPLLDYTKARIPGLRKTLRPALTPLGRTNMAAENPAIRTAKEFLDITDSRSQRTDPVTQEFVRLGGTLTELPKRKAKEGYYTLSKGWVEAREDEPEERYRRRRAFVDPNAVAMMDQLLRHPEYQALRSNPALQLTVLKENLESLRRNLNEVFDQYDALLQAGVPRDEALARVGLR